jgi:hypothetical protein
MDNERYHGKPLLRLLECYVLWAINELPNTELEALRAMAPKLAKIYGTTGEWYEIIGVIAGLPPDAPELLQGLWAKNSEIARKAGANLSAQHFARMFVDQNLAV